MSRNRFMPRLATFLAVVIASIATIDCTAIAGPSQEDRTLRSRLIGRWMASIPVPGGGLHLQARFIEQEDGIAAYATIPQLAMLDQPATSLRVVDGTMDTEFGRAGFRVGIDWAIAEGTVTGRFAFLEGPPGLMELEAVDFTPVMRPALRTAEGATRHDGTLEIPGGGELVLSLVLAEVDGRPHGLIDIPAQGLVGLYLRECDVPEDLPAGSICWSIPAGVEATFVLSPSADSWEGRFRQGALDLPIAFTRAPDAAVVSMRRPQDPVPPFPYEEIEVVVATKAGHELAGTLVVPGGERPASGFPAVVMATGSGAQNRDEELLGHRPFRLLADRFARAGIASLRLDDRGIAGSTGEFETATTRDFANDAAAGLDFLRARPETDATRTGLLGHSEGGTVVALVAAGLASDYPGSAPAFVVSIAGCGVDGGRLLVDQMSRIYLASGVDEADAVRIVELQAKAIELARADETDEVALGDAMVDLQRAQLELTGSEIDDGMEASLRAAGLQLMTTPWMREFIRLDPADAWRRVEVPILAINGTLDLQVSADLNLDAIEAAVEAGGGDLRIVRLEGFNHMLQPTTTGLPTEYGAIETTMDETAMRIMAEFIRSVGETSPSPSGGE